MEETLTRPKKWVECYQVAVKMPPKARSCHQQRHRGRGAQIQRTRQEQFDGSGVQNPCKRAGGELLEGKLYQILEDRL